MANIKQIHGANTFGIEMSHNGVAIQCTLKVRDRSVAQIVCQKVSKLEEAARVGCDADEVGLGEWIKRIRTTLPGLYKAFLKIGIVRDDNDEIEDIISCEETPISSQSEEANLADVQPHPAPVHLHPLKQITKMCGLKYSTLYDLVKCGKLEHRRIGRMIYVTLEDVQKYIDSRYVPCTKSRKNGEA